MVRCEGADTEPVIQGVAAGDLTPGERPRQRPLSVPVSATAARVRRTETADRALLATVAVGLAVAAVVAVDPRLASGTPTAAGVVVHLGVAVLMGRAALGEHRALGRGRRRAVVAAFALVGGAHAGLAVGTAVPYLPLVAAALLLLIGERLRGRRRQWWDAAVVAPGSLAAGLALVAFAGPPGIPLLDGAASPTPAGAVAAPAPAGVAVLMAMLLSCAALGGPRTGPSLRWWAGGLLITAIGAVLAARAGTAPQVRSGAVAGLVVLAGAGLVAVSSLPPPKRPPSDGPARRSSDRFGDPVRVGITPRPPGQALGSIVAVLALVLLGVELLGPDLTGVELPRAAPYLALLALAAALARGIAVRRPQHEGAAGAARTDPLTGLASRKAMSEALAGDPGATRGPDGVPGAGWSGWTDRVALLLVDLDRFEEINVALGREAGDAVLTEVGARLQAVLRPEQLLARLGGDEFAVLLPGAGREPATRVAQALRDALGEPLSLDGTRLHVQATVGVATCLLPRGEPEDLLRQADLAVARAKTAGTGVAVYDPALDRLGPHRLLRIDELRSALEHGDLEVYLQPQVGLASGTIVGAEALARWRHPHDGVLLPEAFLPLAGQTGLLRPVAAAVLDSALGTCARWWARGHRVPVSVNLSADDLRDGDLTERISEHLARHGLPPQALQIELTEDVLVADPLAVAALLRRWRAAGVSVAVDDYGTGYSSLAYLRELPLDELKLDRVFVADLHRRSTLTIVEHTIAMAHGLGLRVVAEGIEDDATAAALAQLGCDVGQGLFFGGAMAPDAFLEHLADESR